MVASICHGFQHISIEEAGLGSTFRVINDFIEIELSEQSVDVQSSGGNYSTYSFLALIDVAVDFFQVETVHPSNWP